MPWLKRNWLVVVLGALVVVLASALMWMKGPSAAPASAETPAVSAVAPAATPAPNVAGTTPDASAAPAPAPVANPGTAPAATPAAAPVKVFHADDAEALAEGQKDLEAAVEAVVAVNDARLHSLEARVERIETGKTPVMKSTPAPATVVETQEEAAIRKLWRKSPRLGGTSYWSLRMEGKEFRLLPTDLPIFRQWVESQEADYQKWAKGRVSN